MLTITETYDLNITDFEGWGGAEKTIKWVSEFGKEDDLEILIEEYFDGGAIVPEELNDFLRYEEDYICRQLGIPLGREELKEEALDWWEEEKFAEAPVGTPESMEKYCDLTPCSACPYGKEGCEFNCCEDELVAVMLDKSIEDIIEMYKDFEYGA